MALFITKLHNSNYQLSEKRKKEEAANSK